MAAQSGIARTFSIRRLRTLILVALLAGVTAFTGIMLNLAHTLSQRFGPQVQADLEWRALRGAQELSKTADLGLAVDDNAMVTESFGAYALSSDVEAIIAVDAQGKPVATHGSFAEVAQVFAGRPGTLIRGTGYVASWARADIEGREVGKIAVVVSTARLRDAEAELADVQRTALGAGGAGAVLGALVILFFTRAVSSRDRQLNDYAHNLEHMVETRTHELDERNRGMHLVLDNVAQGFITLDLRGVMSSERSAIVDRWFGEPAAGVTFSDFLATRAPDFASWFGFVLDSIRDGFMPLELCLEQMPKRFTSGPATFDVAYSPIMRGARPERLLLIISDVTDHIVRERSEREQREMITLFQRVTADRAGFDDLLDDATALVASLAVPRDPLAERRDVHTLKGNCAMFGLTSFAELCHSIESELTESLAPMSDAQRKSLTAAWRAVTRQVAQLVGETRRSVVEIKLSELARVAERARLGTTSRELAAQLVAWSREPVARRFERLGTYAASLALRLGKGELDIAISDDGIRLDTARWAEFWAAMVHAVRNAVDHGLEEPAARAAAGKPVRPKLVFRASHAVAGIAISLTDDGRGIDWDAVRRRATALGLAADTRRDLEAAVFSDGFSTRDAVTETSGRGVGLAVLRDAAQALGGTVQIDSELHVGTTLRWQFSDGDSQVLPVLRASHADLQIG